MNSITKIKSQETKILQKVNGIDIWRRVQGILGKNPSGLRHQRALRNEWV